MSLMFDHHRVWNRRFPAVLAVGLALSVGAACDGDGDGGGNGMGPAGPFTLTFELDDTYQDPHGGQTILVAVVQASNGSVVARADGTVSATADPAFSFTTDAVLEENTAYEVHYWIDSNFNDGEAGVCEDIDTDHQWSVAVPAPSDDVTITESHDPITREDVCASFEFDLTFSGNQEFQDPHGNQAIYAAVVTLDGTVIARASSTVSSTADPAFSFSFPGALVVGIDREIHYWIDSNFGLEGKVGVCDPTANDHQWNVTVSGSTDDVTVTESHVPGDVTSVCETFTADLTFSGDGSFRVAHPDQAINVSVVRASDGAVVATETGVVSATEDPSFSFSFPGIPVIGVAYEIQYWIDSNFGEVFRVGECDAPDVDHQWIIDVPAVEGDVDITDTHRPGEVEDVCGTVAPASFADDIQPIFTNNCAFSGCHGTSNTEPVGKPMVLAAGQARDNIVNVESFWRSGTDRIEPGLPDQSFLIIKIQGTQAANEGDRMPRGAQALPPETIDLIRRWVSEGAKDN